MSSWSEIPQDISLMPTPLAINNLTITRIIVHLLGDKEEGNQEEGEPMETKSLKVPHKHHPPPLPRSLGR